MCFQKINECNALEVENKNVRGQNQIALDNLIPENNSLKMKEGEIEKKV